MRKTINGQYINSFFNFQINTQNKIRMDQIKTPNELSSVLIHEYLHYIQDVSTVYGLMNIDLVFVKINHFYHIPEKDIILPYKNIETTLKIYEDNEILSEIYENPSPYFNLPNYEDDGNEIKIKILEKTLSKDYFSDVQIDEARVHSVKYKKGRKYIKEIEFGAQAIQECMGRIIEDSINPSESDGCYHIPYDLPTMVINHKYKIMAEKKEYIFALCDASLMYYNPADCFIHILNVMKKCKFKPDSLESIYNFIYNCVKFEDITLVEIYENAIKKAKDSISKVTFPGCEPARDWIYKAIDTFRSKRLKNPTFLADLIKDNPKNTLNSFYYFVQDIPSPLIYNNCFNFQVLTDKNNPMKGHNYLMYWYYLEKMYNFVFTDNDLSCPYKEVCIVYKNRKCIVYEKPLVKKDTDCLFDQYKKIFNLQNRNVLNQ